MTKITILNTLLPAPSRTQSDRTFYDLPAGTISKPNPPSLTAEDYYIVINGKEYQCNYFLDGDSRIRVAYKTNNHDTFSISLSKENGTVEMIVRLAEIDVKTGDDIKLICKLVNDEDITIKRAIIKFTNSKTIEVSYDVLADKVDIMEV